MATYVQNCSDEYTPRMASSFKPFNFVQHLELTEFSSHVMFLFHFNVIFQMTECLKYEINVKNMKYNFFMMFFLTALTQISCCC
jgi:hypothetical protein